MNYNYNKIKDMTVEQLLNSFIEFLNEKEFMSINKDCEELLRILSSITKTTRNTLNS